MEVDVGLDGCWKEGGIPLLSGEDTRGTADPFGGGGGGVGVPRTSPPNGGADGGKPAPVWFGNGDAIGAEAIPGVPRLEIAGFVTIGVSFQLDISFAFGGGGGSDAVFCGGAPNCP